jgi:hypothetical protein
MIANGYIRQAYPNKALRSGEKDNPLGFVSKLTIPLPM